MIEIRERGLGVIAKRFLRAKLRLRDVAKEEMEELADEFIRSMRDSLAGAKTTGGLEDSISQKWEGQDKIIISDSAPYSNVFIHGTSGPYKGAPFDPLIAWAKSKGLGAKRGRAIAVSISKRGTMAWGSAYKPNSYPQYGDGTGFDFYRYATEVTMASRVKDVADKIPARVLRESNL